MPSKVALITGVTGQDGAYLARLLLDKGYEVHGMKRRSSSFNTARIDDLLEGPESQALDIRLHYGDLTDSMNVLRLIQQLQPDELYNLGAQSHVQVSFETPEYTANSDAVGVLRVLEAIRILGMEQKTKVYQASTSELYGLVQQVPQNESTPFYPRSPYGVSKLYGYWITKNYREAYGIFAANGILFNHESPLRGETFVTRKITRAVASIKHGFQSELLLGNLDARRDWGHAREYVEGMWRILQHHEADDFVLATGRMTSVREFVVAAFAVIGVELAWNGEGVEEEAVDTATGKVVVRVDPRYFRPTEVEQLQGDSAKAKALLGWEAVTSVEALVRDMVLSDLERVVAERHRILAIG